MMEAFSAGVVRGLLILIVLRVIFHVMWSYALLKHGEIFQSRAEFATETLRRNAAKFNLSLRGWIFVLAEIVIFALAVLLGLTIARYVGEPLAKIAGYTVMSAVIVYGTRHVQKIQSQWKTRADTL